MFEKIKWNLIKKTFVIKEKSLLHIHYRFKVKRLNDLKDFVIEMMKKNYLGGIHYF